MSYVFTRIGPHDFIKEEIGDSGSTNNKSFESVRNVPDDQEPLPMPAWNFEKEGTQKKTAVVNSEEETALPLPVMF